MSVSYGFPSYCGKDKPDLNRGKAGATNAPKGWIFEMTVFLIGKTP